MDVRKYLKHINYKSNIKKKTTIYNGYKETTRYMTNDEFDSLCGRISKKYVYKAMSSPDLNAVRIYKRK